MFEQRLVATTMYIPLSGTVFHCARCCWKLYQSNPMLSQLQGFLRTLPEQQVAHLREDVFKLFKEVRDDIRLKEKSKVLIRKQIFRKPVFEKLPEVVQQFLHKWDPSCASWALKMAGVPLRCGRECKSPYFAKTPHDFDPQTSLCKECLEYWVITEKSKELEKFFPR